MKRREFITILGGAAAAWPLAARAQQRAMPVIGYLDLGSAEPRAHLVAALRRGLNESGYVEGRNVAIEYRWAEGRYDRLSTLASDLVHRRVAVIAAVGGTGTALAAKDATRTIPIVFAIGSDPVPAGLVASFHRPEGNATGVSYFTAELAAKRLGMLHELVPGAGVLAVLVNPSNPNAETTIKDVRDAALAMDRRIEILHASDSREIGTSFAALVQARAAALMTTPDALFTSRRVQIVALAARYLVPTLYTSSEFAKAGGLMSYGTSLEEVYRQVGIYAGRMLNGEKPADLPVQRPTRFELVINLQAAQALDIDIPQTLLARANEVIE
jgi:putative ABC transport system substrate-binding protein